MAERIRMVLVYIYVIVKRRDWMQFIHNKSWATLCANFGRVFTPQPLRAVGVLFSPMVCGWAFGQAGGGKKFVRLYLGNLKV